jgi:hypothetical protein
MTARHTLGSGPLMLNTESLCWRLVSRRLEQALAELLITKQQKLSEYELIRKLSRAPFFLFNENSLSNNMGLFQTHFMLFHTLYKLRNVWIFERHCWLEISPLLIELKPMKADGGVIPCANTQFSSVLEKDTKGDLYSQASGKPSQQLYHPPIDSDPLAAYYLDLSNLFQTSSQTVDKLLNSFWAEYLHPSQKTAALNTLGCSPGTKPVEIRKAYRKLVMKHHPDRGGDAEEFRKLQEAFDILKLDFAG